MGRFSSEVSISSGILMHETRQVSDEFWKQLLGLDKDGSPKKRVRHVLDNSEEAFSKKSSSIERQRATHGHETLIDLRLLRKQKEQENLRQKIHAVSSELQKIADTNVAIVQPISIGIRHTSIQEAKYPTTIESITETIRSLQLPTENSAVWKGVLHQKKQKRLAV